MSYFAANAHCKRIGGKLVEIDSKEENAALVDEIDKRNFTGRRINFWMGLTDLEGEGDWRLASNGLEPQYENWHEGQPNNGVGDHDQDCARLRIGPISSWKDTWSDINCETVTLRNGENPSFSMRALCEFDPTEGESFIRIPLNNSANVS